MKVAAIAALALLAACERQVAPLPPVEDNVTKAVVIAAPAPPVGCADGWTVTLDPDSFANNGANKHFAAARLGMFRDQVETAVRDAVNAACAAGEIAPAKANLVKRLIVHSASGADDPTFFAGDDPATLRLEWVFAEQDLTIPSEMEFRGGLVCWTDPQSDRCAEREP